VSAQPLEPLRLLYELPSEALLDLPDELRQLYGGEIGFRNPSLITNFVSTIDGVVAIPGLRQSNTLISDGNDADRFVLGLLRACADAVLVGSGTMLASPNTLWSAERAYPPAAAAYAELRRRHGRAPQPEIAIVTASGLIDVAHPVLKEGALVLTTEHGAAKLGNRLPGSSQTMVLPGSEGVDLGAAVSVLHERGNELILSEGGPTLFGSLLAAGLVDELFLTISPLLAGRSHNARSSLVEGTELLPSYRLRNRLLAVRSHGDHLFLRYGLEPRT
jgi:riboflavin biosynthesis pyrimidine reductase